MSTIVKGAPADRMSRLFLQSLPKLPEHPTVPRAGEFMPNSHGRRDRPADNVNGSEKTETRKEGKLLLRR